MDRKRYRIVKKRFKGLEISEFTFLDIDNNIYKKASAEDTIKIVESGVVENAEVLFNASSGEHILSIKDGVDSLESEDRSRGIKLELTARIIKDNKCIQYKARDSAGKTYKLSIEKVWELAEQGSIFGVIGKVSGNRKVLLSTEDFDLKSLAKITEN